MRRSYVKIVNILDKTPDELFDKLAYWFGEWVDGRADKTNFKNHLRMVGISEAEFYLWLEKES